jgi:hypothetical protein
LLLIRRTLSVYIRETFPQSFTVTHVYHRLYTPPCFLPTPWDHGMTMGNSLLFSPPATFTAPSAQSVPIRYQGDLFLFISWDQYGTDTTSLSWDSRPHLLRSLFHTLPRDHCGFRLLAHCFIATTSPHSRSPFTLSGPSSNDATLWDPYVAAKTLGLRLVLWIQYGNATTCSLWDRCPL